MDKKYIRDRALLAKFEKNGIDRDINDTNLYVQEYIFKRLFFRAVFLFLVCFCSISFYQLKDTFFIQDLLSKELFNKIFMWSIIFSFLICAFYVIIASVFYSKEYSFKFDKCKNYFEGREKVAKK